MRMPLLASPTIYAAAAKSARNTTPVQKSVALCKHEWTHAYEVAKKKGLAPQKALRMAAVAYKLAMPKMDDLPSIRAAIACIAHGIQLEVFDGRDGSQLLYAAQVALATHRERGKAAK